MGQNYNASKNVRYQYLFLKSIMGQRPSVNNTVKSWPKLNQEQWRKLIDFHNDEKWYLFVTLKVTLGNLERSAYTQLHDNKDMNRLEFKTDIIFDKCKNPLKSHYILPTQEYILSWKLRVISVTVEPYLKVWAKHLYWKLLLDH